MTINAARTQPIQERQSSTRLAVIAAVAVLAVVVVAGIFAALPRAYGATAPVKLGAAGSFSVLSGETITNTGPTVLSKDIGVDWGSAITGFPPGVVLGKTHTADAEAALAKTALGTAYADAKGRTPTAKISGDLAGKTLKAGTYKASSSILLGGKLRLDGKGDPDAIFIFQIPSTLTTATASSVALINKAQSCNVFWQIGSSATLGTYSSFAGSILAFTSITVTTGVSIRGRALARHGSVTLDNNQITTSACAPPPSTKPPTGG